MRGHSIIYRSLEVTKTSSGDKAPRLAEGGWVHERGGLVWQYVGFAASDWSAVAASGLGNRCDVFKQVGIAGMSGITLLDRTLHVEN